jgi:hypothetical protein
MREQEAGTRCWQRCECGYAVHAATCYAAWRGEEGGACAEGGTAASQGEEIDGLVLLECIITMVVSVLLRPLQNGFPHLSELEFLYLPTRRLREVVAAEKYVFRHYRAVSEAG